MLQKALNLHQSGQLDEALLLYNKVLKKDKNNGDALNLKGILLASSGKLEEAKKTFERAVKLYPKNIDFKYSLQNLYRDSGDLSLSKNLLVEILKLDKNHLSSLKALASLYYNQKKYLEAKFYYSHYNELNSLDFESVYCLAHCFYLEKKYLKAISLFQKCLLLDSANTLSVLMIGVSYLKLKKYDIAVQFFDMILELDPENKDSLYFKSTSLFSGDKFQEAYEIISFLFKKDPNFKSTLSKYINYSKACLLEYPQSLEKKLNKTIFDAGDIEECIEEPYETLRRTDNLELNLKCAKQFVSLIESKVKTSKFKYIHKQKIKVAYLSGDFHEHPVGISIEGVLKNHSDKEIEFCMISLKSCTGSEMSKRIRSTNIKFYDCSKLSKLELVEKVKSLNLSILVDLIGHYNDVCIDLHLNRVAALQVWYLGYAGTSGCKAIDYLISDKICIPQESKKFYTEKIFYLDQIYHSYTPINDLKKVKVGPLNCLENGTFTLGLFTNSTKISIGLLDSICKLLLNLPQAILVVNSINKFALNNLLKKLESKGINKSRCIVFPFLEERSVYLKKITCIDLLLDTEVHNAHSTLLDFLYMGIPAIGLRGNQFSARVSASFLENIGLSELVADSFLEYYEIISDLYFNKDKYIVLRQKLSNNLKTTTMFDPKKKAKDLESAYKTMWKKYLESRKS
ncbi:MAG: hypothetical protein COB02_09855 [Candidatus Cloacimonadota bacterium]|nr:MAG: hypothetical protein COB02_09855 [Candidatus Cloacimonadota bacterium]